MRCARESHHINPCVVSYPALTFLTMMLTVRRTRRGRAVGATARSLDRRRRRRRRRRREVTTTASGGSRPRALGQSASSCVSVSSSSKALQLCSPIMIRTIEGGSLQPTKTTRTHKKHHAPRATRLAARGSRGSLGGWVPRAVVVRHFTDRDIGWRPWT